LYWLFNFGRILTKTKIEVRAIVRRSNVTKKVLDDAPSEGFSHQNSNMGTCPQNSFEDVSQLEPETKKYIDF